MTIRNITDQKAEKDSKIYDLNGHCLRKAPEKGLHIQDGQKKCKELKARSED